MDNLSSKVTLRSRQAHYYGHSELGNVSIKVLSGIGNIPIKVTQNWACDLSEEMTVLAGLISFTLL